ncbi:MAG: rhodanese-like domain-containing protein [Saprospiraceae bacterium]
MADQCNIKRWDLLKGRLKNVPATSFSDWWAAHPTVLLIDCRRADEHQAVHLEGSVNIDYLAYSFWDEIEKLPRDGCYLLYCNTSRRSTRACTLMQNAGYEQTFNLDGGLKAWKEKVGDIIFEKAVVRKK